MGYDEMPKYLLGTTEDGKDIIKLAFTSLRTSLLLAIFVSAFCLMFGLCWGAISGYFGGNVDLIMERITDIIAGVPYIVVMTLAILLLGNNIVTFGMALCLTSWIGVAARTRTQFYRFKGREYVLASRTLGASDKRLIFRHILPNALGTIVTSSVLMIPSVIFSESTLAYLNLGLKGVDSFGVLLSTNQRFLSTYPALIVFPSIIISLLMISFNLFGNGLRDALNPSLKGSE
jgi:oligopeptide transport system permease protein